MIPVPLIDLKSLKEFCRLWCRDFRAAVLGQRDMHCHLLETTGILHKKRLAAAYFLGKNRRTSRSWLDNNIQARISAG